MFRHPFEFLRCKGIISRYLLSERCKSPTLVGEEAVRVLKAEGLVICEAIS